MAFVYEYGKGRVFQTVLGHDAAALRNPGTAELVRRGSTWAAGRTQLAAVEAESPQASPARQRQDDKVRAALFRAALDGAAAAALAAERTEYQEPPLTVECRARLRGKTGFNLLVANGPKESATHWEIYTTAGSGTYHRVFAWVHA